MPPSDEAGSGNSPDMPVIGVGASAGGLEALRDMFSAAQLPTGMAFVVIQHLDPTQDSLLAELLDRSTDLNVVQAEGGERLRPDTVFIIPPGHGLAIRSGVLELTEFAQPRGLRRPIDDFFASLATDQQANAACVILSGTGSDGTTGLRAIKENGGVCVVQKPDTAKYDGMPVSAIGTGLVDFVEISGDILPRLATFFARRHNAAVGEEAEHIADQIDDLCAAIKAAVGHDFSGYKRSTFIRRVERRMHVLGITSGREYLARVQNDAKECSTLFRDLLINVTRFFRDQAYFDRLRDTVIQPLVASASREEEIRVWVAGCSSGEEAYTIAMLFAEAVRKDGRSRPVQIFATDIDEQMLQIAREGAYPLSSLADIPAALRELYTVLHTDRFTIDEAVRDMVRFSNHSLVKDPPFSRIDLVSCRNLLIYFDDRLQQQVMPLLHYALRPGGHLFLGPSESIGRFEQLFRPVDAQSRLFERASGPPAYPLNLPGSIRDEAPRRSTKQDRETGDPMDQETIAVRRLIDRYAPASMVLDADGGILAAYGRLSRYFDFPVTRTGGSSAISLARPGLREVIGPLLRQGRDGRKRMVARGTDVRTEYGVQRIDVVCDPLEHGRMLFVFQETEPFRVSSDPELQEIDAGDDHLESLEDELRLTRHRLRTAVEELETANEELKSSNEEMMSMNEELQSTNEELSTVNDELKSKVDQFTVANADLRNFFESTELAVVVLDRDLRVRSFTEASSSVFPFQVSDKGRPLGDVTSRLDTDAYLEDARSVVDGGPAVQRRVNSRDGTRTWSMRVLPYRTQTGTVDGATLVLTDITDALSLERELESGRERLDMAIRAGGIGVWEYCPRTGATFLDEAEQSLLGITGGEAKMDAILAQIVPDDRDAVAAKLEQAWRGHGDFEATFRMVMPDGSIRRIKGFARLMEPEPPRLIGVSIDVTSEFAVAETRGIMLREMNHRVKNLFAIIAGLLTAGARSHTDVRSFTHDLRERIAGLGRAHSLASPPGFQESIDLQDLIAETLAPYQNQMKIELDGPNVEIDRSCLSPLALMTHEWATNSMKYGALGSENGTLHVHWSFAEDGINLRWVEKGVGTVSTGGAPGFGTLLVDTSSRQLRARVERIVEPDSFTLDVHLPQSVLVA
ncbi:CheR family methyltransferase [Sphingomonas sp. IW22]|uniref:CheR family methyltransferase n=1 Tax=Sphingomonas sp. IW22 TaxID=3242489 RepID=UPI003520B7BF